MAIRSLSHLPDARRALAVLHGEVRFIDQSWHDALAGCGLAPDSDWSRLSPGHCVSRSDITNCFKVPLSGARSFFFKRYTYPTPRQYRYWMRASKAQIEVFGYAQLKKLGIPTLNVIAFGEKRVLGKLCAAYIVTEGIDHSVDLQHFASTVWYEMPRKKRSACYAQLRQLLFSQLNKAHAARFFHQDLHWRNILVTQQQGVYQTVWIDCPRAAYRRWSTLAKHGQMVDLSCLARRSLDYMSRSERYRALDAYLKVNNLGWTTRNLFREIQAHHQRSPNPPKSLGIPGAKKQFSTPPMI